MRPASGRGKRGCTLTAIQIRVVSNTGALRQSWRRDIGASSASRSRSTGGREHEGQRYAVYTNTPPLGAFRGYGSSQTVIRRGIAMGDLARKLGMNLFRIASRNVVVPGDAVTAFGKGLPMRRWGVRPRSVMDFVRSARQPDVARRAGSDEWLEGKGHAIICTIVSPPRSNDPRPLNLRATDIIHKRARRWETGPSLHAAMAASILQYYRSPSTSSRGYRRAAYDTGTFSSVAQRILQSPVSLAAENLRDNR